MSNSILLSLLAGWGFAVGSNRFCASQQRLTLWRQTFAKNTNKSLTSLKWSLSCSFQMLWRDMHSSRCHTQPANSKTFGSNFTVKNEKKWNYKLHRVFLKHLNGFLLVLLCSLYCEWDECACFDWQGNIYYGTQRYKRICAVSGCHKRKKCLQIICFDHNTCTRAVVIYDLHPLFIILAY